jgi:hypothetical protein
MSKLTSLVLPIAKTFILFRLMSYLSSLYCSQLFEPFGTVELVQLPLDLGTGQCKGFGFVQVGDHNHLSIAKILCAI